MRRIAKAWRKRLIQVLALAAMGAIGFTEAHGQTVASWVNPVSGSWTDATMWSTNPDYPNNGAPPGSQYAAIISAIGSDYQITLNSDITLSSALLDSTNASVLQSSTLQLQGILDVRNGVWELGPFGAKISGGTITSTGSGSLLIRSSNSGSLDGVTLSAPIHVQSSGLNSARLGVNGLTLDGGQIILNQVGGGATASLQTDLNNTIDGTGEILLGTSNTAISQGPNNSTLTLAAGIRVRTIDTSASFAQAPAQIGEDSGNRLIINHGTISAETLNRAIWLRGMFDNRGHLQTTNGGVLRIQLGPGWSNTGSITINNGTLQLVGEVDETALGSLTRTGGTVHIAGPLNNSGKTLPLDAFQGGWVIGSVTGGLGRIDGGTISAAGGISELQIVDRTVFADGVTLDADARVHNARGLFVSDGMTLNGQLTMAAGGTIVFSGPHTVGGNGLIVMDDSPTGQNPTRITAQLGTLTIGSGIEIRTGIQGGTITTNSPSDFIINQGTLAAVTGGKTLAIEGNWRNLGTLKATDGTLSLGGTFTSASLANLVHSGGVVSIVGSVDNTGSVLALNASTGSIDLGAGGRITGGTITSSDSSQFLRVTGSATLENVSPLVDLLVANGATLTAKNSPIANAGHVTRLASSGSATLVNVEGSVGSDGEIHLGGTSGQNQVRQTSGTLTISAGVLVRTAESGGGTLGFGSGVLNNLGTLSARTAGHSLVATGTSVFNNGVLEAIDGGSLVVQNLQGSLGSVSLASGGKLTVSGTYTNDQPRLVTDASELALLGTWTNNSRIDVSNGTLTIGGTPAALGTISLNNAGLNIAGSFTTSTILAIPRSNTAVSVVSGGTVNNLEQTIELSPTSPWKLGGGTISGGTINSTGGVALDAFAGSSTIDGVVLNANLLVSSGAAVTFSGTSQLSSSTIDGAGAIVVTGTLNNGGNVLSIDSSPQWYVQGAGRLHGGTVSMVPDAVVKLNGGNLSSLTLQGGRVEIEALSGTVSTVHGAVVLDGTTMALGVGTTGGVLSISNGASIGGSGTILFDGTSSLGILLAAGTGTVGDGITLRTGTRGAQIGNFSGSTLHLNGTVSSQTPGASISFVGNISNNGLIEARNGGTMLFSAFLINYGAATGTLTGGSWAAYANSTISFLGSSTITTNNATILLDGLGSNFVPINSLRSNLGHFTITNGRNFTTVGSLTNSGTLVIGPDSAMKVLDSLNNTGTVDLNGALIVDYTGESPLSALVAQIGTNIISSTASSDPSKRIGYAEASALGVTTFAGLPVDSTSALLKLTFGGDTDLDGDVDVADLGRLASNWQSSASWIGGDFDYNGFVDVTDLGLLASNWQAGVDASLKPTAGPWAFEEALRSFGLPGASVPEPGALGVLVIPVALKCHCRWKRRGA